VDAGRSDPSGDYQREVTEAELESIGEASRPEGSQPPPAGMYRLTLTSGTIIVVDPDEFSRIASPSPHDSLLGESTSSSPPHPDGVRRVAILTGTWTKTG
jgi:hypothetical protein